MAGHRHAPPPQPRYARIVAAATSVGITAVAVLGGVGILPTGTTTGAAYAGALAPSSRLLLSGYPGKLIPDRAGRPAASPEAAAPSVPARSGEGRRVVFDMGEQRVWLVGAAGAVRRTYLVSGSLTDNLEAGSYEVYSRSRNAVGIDDSGTMNYMVRFAHGERAAIGFHDIPVHRGEKVQGRAELGTPQSHGCIRQARPDAIALWRFAPVGTSVVVTD